MKCLVWLCFFLVFDFCAGVSYEVCEEGGVTPWLTPSEVTLDPTNPHRGDDAVFKISGHNKHTARSGEFIIDVYMVTKLLGRKRLVPIRKETDSLCDHTKCPLRPGDATIKYTRHLPSITPPGTYMVKVMAKDPKGKLILCVEVEFGISQTLIV